MISFDSHNNTDLFISMQAVYIRYLVHINSFDIMFMSQADVTECVKLKIVRDMIVCPTNSSGWHWPLGLTIDAPVWCSLIAILLFIKLLEYCTNDYVMFVRYMSFNMRINNKKTFWTGLNWFTLAEIGMTLLYDLPKVSQNFQVFSFIDFTGLKCLSFLSWYNY